MLNAKKKEKVIKEFQLHKGDTGSSEVQIAILTKEIEELAKHLKKHYHDFSSRRGLLKKISQRKKLIKYLMKENADSLFKLAKKLKLKIAKKIEEQRAIEAEEKAILEEKAKKENNKK
ncbi:30S ribosomal protein S15 [Candidatus Falkowbacteria bacterium]|jgi:small subunit ribosomal protein S15|nr:30S ribosomal protein S15 [Candidatus Falkowbacteria bacterium]MBT4432954.1 30S ribosomal protein S15 [Candidatus Falkowbacteria bacterium]